MLLATTTLSALIIPLTEGREAGWPWWTWLSLLAVPLLASLLWRYERRLRHYGGSPLLDPAVLRAPGLGQGLTIILLFYSIGAFFLLFSVYLQGALHLNALNAGLLFLPFGVGFLIGPLLTPYLRRFVGNYLSAIGMGCETSGLAGLAGLIATTLTGNLPHAAARNTAFCYRPWPGAGDANAGADGDRPRCPGIFRYDCRRDQLDITNQHCAERRRHRRHFLQHARQR
jgi:predicted MFS family arabinose efflux permease